MFVPLPLEFYLNYTVSNEIQGLSSIDHNFQGLSRPSIFILNFKDFQGACKPCCNSLLFGSSVRRQNKLFLPGLQRSIFYQPDFGGSGLSGVW